MRRRVALFVLVVLAVFAASGCETKSRVGREYSIDQFLATKNYGGATFSPDGKKILVSSNASDIFNAYAIPIDGGAPVALTESTKEAIWVRGYFPADERFLYQSDQGGNELDHVYVREMDGTVKDLTPGEKLKAIFMGWAWDEKSFYVATNERDPRYFDVYEYDPQTYERQLIHRNEAGYDLENSFPGGDRRALVVSPDRRYLALTLFDTRSNSDVYLYDTQTGSYSHLTPHEGEIIYQAETFGPDGSKVYLLTDRDNEFQYLARVGLDGSGFETVVKPDWDVWYAYFSRDGGRLIVGINRDAATEVQVYEADSMKPIELPKMSKVDIQGLCLSRDGSRLAFYAGSSKAPGDLYVADFSRGTPKRLTRSLNPEIDERDLVSGEVVRFFSADSVTIPGILYMPHEASPANKVPALVWVHGGPGGQSRVGYIALIQYMVNHGYAVYAINNRGSSGYGKTFFRMDDRQHGKGDLDDCVESKEMLAATGRVDPERIGIIGGSYGGFMVLAAQAFRPGEFAVGVDIFGVSNWVRTLRSIPPWWESFRKSLEAEMGDFNDEDYLRSISPLFHAERITTPMIVLQGANDPRVLQIESDEIVEALKRNGVDVEYVVFDDEGHGFEKTENRKRGYEAIVKFLDKHLKPLGGRTARS